MLSGAVSRVASTMELATALTTPSNTNTTITDTVWFLSSCQELDSAADGEAPSRPTNQIAKPQASPTNTPGSTRSSIPTNTATNRIKLVRNDAPKLPKPAKTSSIRGVSPRCCFSIMRIWPTLSGPNSTPSVTADSAITIKPATRCSTGLLWNRAQLRWNTLPRSIISFDVLAISFMAGPHRDVWRAGCFGKNGHLLRLTTPERQPGRRTNGVSSESHDPEPSLLLARDREHQFDQYLRAREPRRAGAGGARRGPTSRHAGATVARGAGLARTSERRAPGNCGHRRQCCRARPAPWRRTLPDVQHLQGVGGGCGARSRRSRGRAAGATAGAQPGGFA